MTKIKANDVKQILIMVNKAVNFLEYNIIEEIKIF